MYATPIEQIADGNGKPISGAKKFLFSVGTTTKKTVYSDEALTVARANPVLSDADGRFPQFYLSGLYDEIQQDNSGTATGYDGATLWGPIPIGEVTEGALTLWAADNTYDIPEIVLGSDDNYYRSLTDSNTGNDPVSSPGSWEQLQWGRVWNTNITYTEGDTAYGVDGFLYISTVDSNLANNPPTSSNNWRPAANIMQSAIGAGTVDAITAVFPVPFTALNDETIISVRASGANTITNPTFAPDGFAAKTITKNGNQALVTGDIFGTGHELLLKYNLPNGVWELINPSPTPAGSIIQVISVSDGAVSTGTTVLPSDDTIPQNTEGDEYMSLSITPKFDDSILIVRFSGMFASTISTYMTVALFQDSTASSLAATFNVNSSVNSAETTMLDHTMTSGTTSSTTFSIRAGAGGANTTTFNGFSSGRLLGGVASSFMSITEIKV
jgi:hypothetical protein